MTTFIYRLVLFAMMGAVVAACETTTGINNIEINGGDEIAISVPDGFVVELFADGLELPTSVEFPPDGSDRLFVNELQSGKIWIYEHGVRLSQPFAELQTSAGGGFPGEGERGLVGLEFDPDYEQNGFIYVTFAFFEDENSAQGVGTIARFRDENNVGRDYTELMTGLPSAVSHQIQNLGFGPDDKLYVSIGDSHEERDVQRLDTYNGKILRINRDGTVPDDNPFIDDADARPEIYALGFRNAFDMTFRANGDLIVADNGPVAMDRLLVVEAGGNYGWPEVAGFHGDPDFIEPIHVWEEMSVSPTGIHAYQGDQFPAEYQGKLFQVLFGWTYTEGPNPAGKRVQVLHLEGQGQQTTVEVEDFAVYEFEGIGNPVDITEGPDGSLYISDIFKGKIFRIRYEG